MKTNHVNNEVKPYSSLTLSISPLLSCSLSTIHLMHAQLFFQSFLPKVEIKLSSVTSVDKIISLKLTTTRGPPTSEAALESIIKTIASGAALNAVFTDIKSQFNKVRLASQQLFKDLRQLAVDNALAHVRIR